MLACCVHFINLLIVTIQFVLVVLHFLEATFKSLIIYQTKCLFWLWISIVHFFKLSDHVFVLFNNLTNHEIISFEKIMLKVGLYGIGPVRLPSRSTPEVMLSPTVAMAAGVHCQ